MSVSAQGAVAANQPATRARVMPLAIILGVGFVLRLVFLPSLGFHNDVAAFESWTLTLHQYPPWQFYAKTSFADYPPGYFAILWVLGWIYGALGNLHLISFTDPNYFGLRILVKLPALVMDLVDTALIYGIVRRYASERIALVAAGFFALNPATIYTSAYWGQIDSVSWGFVLLALWLVIRSEDDPSKTTVRLTWAWLALGYSILIKPQGALIALVLVAFAFTTDDAAKRRLRLIGTASGIGSALALTWAISVLFHGSFNPIADAGWLLNRYAYGSTVYPYNTINAFNLYAIKQPFWQSDLASLPLFGIPAGPMLVWGIVLTLSAVALIVARYLQRRDDRGLVEASMLVAFAFFVLATRMHERYIFGAFLLAFPLIAFGRRYLWVAAILSVTTLANLIYSFTYQSVMESHLAGVDPTNLWPFGSHVLAAVNVVLFFGMGYIYLGGSSTVLEGVERDAKAALAVARSWFAPGEGLARMTRVDWLAGGLLSLASFAICILWIQWPAEKIFDEIYYARAGEEYLRHVEIFEFTHPPLTKLVVTLSMILFGGLHGLGDTGIGWRFLNVVVGALTVIVLYAFAKRLTRSTLFATIAGGMLVLDGFHFVQSRIATPEITVAFFSLCTLYAFYCFWTASGARRAPRIPVSATTIGTWVAFLAVGAVVAGGVATAAIQLGPSQSGSPDNKVRAFILAFLFVETLFYLAARWMVARGRTTFVSSYADGSRVLSEASTPTELILPGGDQLALGGKKGSIERRADGEAERRYARDGTLVYVTPAEQATFDPDGTVTVNDESTGGRKLWVWLAWLSVASGAVAASKWNGLFDFFVVWFCAAGVVGQRYLRRVALYGNPYGIPLDILIGVMFVVSATIYTLCYIPYFTLGHNLVDLLGLQQQMFDYHDHLVATHPYASAWWTWPILERPISYYYHDFRTGAGTNDPTACCVAEILALPNPFVWWFGLITVPAIAVLGWFERNRGYVLLIAAYLLQWLPWVTSPRITFEYHFYPNLAIIVLANTIVLQRLWSWIPSGALTPKWPRVGVVTYLAVVTLAFAFFYPVLVGQHVPWDAWHARMWFPRWII